MRGCNGNCCSYNIPQKVEQLSSHKSNNSKTATCSLWRWLLQLLLLLLLPLLLLLLLLWALIIERVWLLISLMCEQKSTFNWIEFNALQFASIQFNKVQLLSPPCCCKRTAMIYMLPDGRRHCITCHLRRAKVWESHLPAICVCPHCPRCPTSHTHVIHSVVIAGNTCTCPKYSNVYVAR